MYKKGLHRYLLYNSQVNEVKFVLYKLIKEKRTETTSYQVFWFSGYKKVGDREGRFQ